jgi:hypothetical protein
MKIINLKILVVAGAVLTACLAGCSSDSLEDLHPGVFDTPTTPCDTDSMTYEVHMKPLFLTKCGSDQTDCHKAPNTAQKNLDNYADARDLAINGDMMSAILHEPGYTPMPNNGTTLDQCSINMIQAWINRGCPEN